ncbi:MAG: hypothetical protein IKP77_05290 [Acholeplasmatales bacterium]|nr:hypothetical protein [Acholeplasmatales bacterium]
MKEVKLSINRKINISELIINKFKEIKLKEYYMREFRKENETIYFFVYEHSYKTFKQVSYFMRRPGEIIVTTSIVAKVTNEETEVSFVISTDEDEQIPNYLLVSLLERGFKIVE